MKGDKTTEIKLRCLKCDKIRTANSFDYSANMCKAGRGGHLWTIVWTGGTEGQKPQTTDDLKHLAAELKQLRNIIAFYGVEIMPDGSFTSPRITQNEVDVTELREFVGAMRPGSAIFTKGGAILYGGDGNWYTDHHGKFDSAIDAYRKMKAGEGE